MKRNTPEHWKMDDLATRLGVCLAQAVGHMELLFHLTAKQAIHGNIGKIPNQSIAKKCGWDGDADKFVKALVQSRWVDECVNQRLIIHDWHEHCDDATKKAVIRSGIDFYRPISRVADNGGQSLPLPDTESDKICLPSLALPSLAPADGDDGQTDLVPTRAVGDKPRNLDEKAADLATQFYFYAQGRKPVLEEIRSGFKEKLRFYGEDKYDALLAIIVGDRDKTLLFVGFWIWLEKTEKYRYLTTVSPPPRKKSKEQIEQELEYDLANQRSQNASRTDAQPRS